MLEPKSVICALRKSVYCLTTWFPLHSSMLWCSFHPAPDTPRSNEVQPTERSVGSQVGGPHWSYHAHWPTSISPVPYTSTHFTSLFNRSHSP